MSDFLAVWREGGAMVKPRPWIVRARETDRIRICAIRDIVSGEG